MVQVGAGGAVAALLAAPPDAAHLAGQLGTAVGAALAALALAVQPSRRAARLCASTRLSTAGLGCALRGWGVGQGGGRHSPRHTWVLQIWLSRPSPGHTGCWHRRRRSRSPPPHETLQGPHGDHAPHGDRVPHGTSVGAGGERDGTRCLGLPGSGGFSW